MRSWFYIISLEVNMVKDLCIVDYIGNSNENNEPIGHPVKVINDFFELLCTDVNIKLAIAIIYKGKINDINKTKEIIWLERWSQITTKNRLQKIVNVLNKIKNIKQAVNSCKCKNIWFINVDFCLGIVLMLYKNKFKDRNIIVTLCIDHYKYGGIGSKIKNYFYQKIIKNVSNIFSSNNNLSFHSNSINIPDYFYSDKLYSKYKDVIKENKVVCIGTMNESKDLEGLISIFNKININLYIIGPFFNKEQFDKCILIKEDNITIENIILDKERYYNLIAGSKYVIIPYKEDAYSNRTSGVLLETIFLKSIPIAPKFLLNFNNIKGVGYESLNELFDFFSNEKEKDIYNCINDLVEIDMLYMDENVRHKIIRILK